METLPKTQPMDPRVKDLWIKALESGDYKKGRYLLRDVKNSYCCYGVLCDLHSKETGKEWGVPVGVNARHRYDGAEQYIPEEVQKWAGMKEHNPTFQAPHPQDDVVCTQTLTSVNDITHDFSEVIQLIKEHF